MNKTEISKVEIWNYSIGKVGIIRSERWEIYEAYAKQNISEQVWQFQNKFWEN